MPAWPGSVQRGLRISARLKSRPTYCSSRGPWPLIPDPCTTIGAMPSVAPLGRRALALAIIVAALGYFVDIYDLILFSIVRVRSLTEIGVPQAQIFTTGV